MGSKMRYREGCDLRLLGSAPEISDRDDHAQAAHVGAETAHSLLRFIAWLVHGEWGDRQGLPVRVFYKFDSGGWRSRSTRQLHKVYRCR